MYFSGPKMRTIFSQIGCLINQGFLVLSSDLVLFLNLRDNSWNKNSKCHFFFFLIATARDEQLDIDLII